MQRRKHFLGDNDGERGINDDFGAAYSSAQVTRMYMIKDHTIRPSLNGLLHPSEIL